MIFYYQLKGFTKTGWKKAIYQIIWKSWDVFQTSYEKIEVSQFIWDPGGKIRSLQVVYY